MLRKAGFVLTAIFILVAGCSVSNESPIGIDSSSDVLVNDNTSGAMQTAHPGPVSWGVWEVTIDPYNSEISITPLRSADFMANVVMFLQPPAGSLSNLILSDMVVDLVSQPGYIIIDVDVGLQHPFPGLDQYTGFDVRGIFMQDSQFTSDTEPDVTYAGPGVARQLNPDGHSRWMNAIEFTTSGILGFTEGKAGTPQYVPTATLNPYKYFTDNLDADQSVTDFFSDPLNVEKRGYFRPGSVNYRHYSLIWPSGPLTFQYAVIASYEESIPVPPENIPDDFPMSANCAEAFHLEITDNGSTAYYIDPSNKGGDLHLNLEVFDWGVLWQSSTVTEEIGEIVIESPGNLIAAPITLDPTTLAATPGTDVSSVYQIDIPGVDPDSVTGQYLLCRVTSAKHTTYDYGFGSACPTDPLAAYLILEAPITGEPQGDPPTAVAEACSCLWIPPGGTVSFSGAQSYDNIVQWEWDFGDGSPQGNGETVSHVFGAANVYDVNLTVTDSIGASDSLGPTELLHVHVGSFANPVADAHIAPTIGLINFDGVFEAAQSLGSINLYEWDFEPDCIWDYQHPSNGDTTHAYTAAGIYDPILRVTGTGCDSISTVVRMIDPLGIIDNGNFWNGDWDPWTHGHGGYGNKTETIMPNDTYKWMIHFLRTSSYNDGGICYAQQVLNQDVSTYDSLSFNFFFNLVSSTCPGDGWMGGELDMAVRIVYDDGTGSAPYWRQAWFGWDRNPDSTWQWDTSWLPWYVTYHEQEGVSSGQWYERSTGDLMTKLSPPPIEIKWIRIDTSGWDFNTYFALPWFSEE